MSVYPEHDKLTAISDQSQTVGEFLEWLSEQGVHRMQWKKVTDQRECRLCGGAATVHVSGRGRYTGGEVSCPHCHGKGHYEIEFETWVEDGRSIQTLLAEFFGVDQDKIEAEKRAMLDALRSAS